MEVELVVPEPTLIYCTKARHQHTPPFLLIGSDYPFTIIGKARFYHCSPSFQFISTHLKLSWLHTIVIFAQKSPQFLYVWIMRFNG